MSLSLHRVLLESRGVVTIKQPDNSTLTDGQIIAGAVSTFIYDGTNFRLASVHKPIEWHEPVKAQTPEPSYALLALICIVLIVALRRDRA